MTTAPHHSPARVHNFCAGPCTLPTSILEEVRDDEEEKKRKKREKNK